MKLSACNAKSEVVNTKRRKETVNTKRRKESCVREHEAESEVVSLGFFFPELNVKLNNDSVRFA